MVDVVCSWVVCSKSARRRGRTGAASKGLGRKHRPNRGRFYSHRLADHGAYERLEVSNASAVIQMSPGKEACACESHLVPQGD